MLPHQLASSSTTITDPIFPRLRSFKLRYRDNDKYDSDCSLFSILVALLSGSTMLHTLHLYVHPSLASMLLLAPLTTLRKLYTRWENPPQFLAPTYVSRVEADRWFVDEIVGNSDTRKGMGMRRRRLYWLYPTEFVAERVFAADARRKRQHHEQQLMDGREAFFAWVATRKKGTQQPGG